MAAGRYNLQILQGKLFEQTFTWKIDGTPVDLTGYGAKLRIYDDNDNSLLSLTSTPDVDGNGLTLGGSAGTVKVTIKTAKTKQLAFSKARYELELTRPDGEDIAFLAGNAYVTAEAPEL